MQLGSLARKPQIDAIVDACVKAIPSTPLDHFLITTKFPDEHGGKAVRTYKGTTDTGRGAYTFTVDEADGNLVQEVIGMPHKLKGAIAGPLRNGELTPDEAKVLVKALAKVEDEHRKATSLQIQGLMGEILWSTQLPLLVADLTKWFRTEEELFVNVSSEEGRTDKIHSTGPVFRFADKNLTASIFSGERAMSVLGFETEPDRVVCFSCRYADGIISLEESDFAYRSRILSLLDEQIR